jgi:hypothetical protein
MHLDPSIGFLHRHRLKQYYHVLLFLNYKLAQHNRHNNFLDCLLIRRRQS